MSEIYNTIKDILICNNTNLTEMEITSKTHLIRDLGIDSVSLMTFVVLIEERFNIELPDEFLTEENLSNLGNIVTIIEQLLSKK